MSIAKVYLVNGLFFLVLSSSGCGQKGPLYLDETQEANAKPVKIENQERLKKREGLEQQHETPPDITY